MECSGIEDRSADIQLKGGVERGWGGWKEADACIEITYYRLRAVSAARKMGWGVVESESGRDVTTDKLD